MFLSGFLLCGSPRFVMLALDTPLWAILVTVAVGEFGAGFINRAGSDLLRAGTTPSARPGERPGGLPVLVRRPAGWDQRRRHDRRIGLSPALFIAGGIYLAATLVPGLRPEWEEMDRKRSTDHPSRTTAPV